MDRSRAQPAGSVWLWPLALWLSACSAPAPTPPQPPAPAAATGPAPTPAAAVLVEQLLAVPLPEDAALRARVLRSPHSWLRRLNVPLSQAVCERFEQQLDSMPLVNLHGDAHVEQYAVTPDSAGLLDFDDSSIGPALIDLSRFGTSLGVAAAQLGREAQAGELLDALLDGYRASLRDPRLEDPEPEVVARVRQGFGRKPSEFLSWVESISEPVESVDLEQARAGYERYVEMMLERHPDLDRGFFELKWIVKHTLGIGGLGSKRYLGRIEGPTSAPRDDIILEAKELRDLTGIDCVIARRGDALRVVLAQTRIARRHDPFLAIVPRGEDESPNDWPFWVQSWSVNYTELTVGKQLTGLEDLRQVARDVGIQLARGHCDQFEGSHGEALREAQLHMLDRYEAPLRELVAELTGAVWASWQRVRPAAAGG